MVSEVTRCIVWARSAGRCEYPGCNRLLIGDLISRNSDGNFGLIAHIVAATAGGPRGDPLRSPKLADNPDNLMLLCYEHHKHIDTDGLCDHPEQVLLEMKSCHERRIGLVTDIAPDRASHVLCYGAKIGLHHSPLSFARVREAMIPERYPAEARAISVEIIGSALQDDESRFWDTEPDSLRRQFDTLVRSRIANREIEHLSVFALGPIPLLVDFGRLLCDIASADVYQLHREPAGWTWARTGDHMRLRYALPPGNGKTVALKLALSATITDDRIVAALGDDVAIWSITAEGANNDILRYPEDLGNFRSALRRTYNEIKEVHGSGTVINVFPAVPVSAAVEIGRVWMPKADLPMVIHDETRGRGFVPRIQIG